MRKYRILLVEDDKNLGFVIQDHLEEAGYEVIHCTDGEMAYKEFMKHVIDLCLIDVMLPKKDGLTLVQQIRKKNEQIALILLTARSHDDDKIAGFKNGADDYITKPFNMEELLLRVDVHLKRTKRAELSTPSMQWQLGSLTFDYKNLTLSDGQNITQLTLKEADLLKYFVSNQNIVLKRDDILINVWGKDDYFLGRSMDVFVTKLRKYLKPEKLVEIQTIHGIGFKFILHNQ